MDIGLKGEYIERIINNYNVKLFKGKCNEMSFSIKILILIKLIYKFNEFLMKS